MRISIHNFPFITSPKTKNAPPKEEGEEGENNKERERERKYIGTRM